MCVLIKARENVERYMPTSHRCINIETGEYKVKIKKKSSTKPKFLRSCLTMNITLRYSGQMALLTGSSNFFFAFPTFSLSQPSASSGFKMEVEGIL